MRGLRAGPRARAIARAGGEVKLGAWWTPSEGSFIRGARQRQPSRETGEAKAARGDRTSVEPSRTGSDPERIAPRRDGAMREALSRCVIDHETWRAAGRRSGKPGHAIRLG